MSFSDEERAILTRPCYCGHSWEDHGDLTGCWECEGACPLASSYLLEERLQQVIDKRINDGATGAERGEG